MDVTHQKKMIHTFVKMYSRATKPEGHETLKTRKNHNLKFSQKSVIKSILNK